MLSTSLVADNYICTSIPFIFYVSPLQCSINVLVCVWVLIQQTQYDLNVYEMLLNFKGYEHASEV